MSKAKIYHFDLYGLREEKYQFLNSHSFYSIDWKELSPTEPNFFFVPRNLEGKEEYERGFKVDELFKVFATGIKTQRDDASIKFTQQECDEIKADFLNLSEDNLREKYGFKDVRDWKISYAKEDLKQNSVIANRILYRPFDVRYMNYTGKTKGVMGYPRLEIMQHLMGDNIAILVPRQAISYKFGFFISKGITDINYTGSAGQYGAGLVFPLYLYIDKSKEGIFSSDDRVPNLNMKIVEKIEKRLNLAFIEDDNFVADLVAEVDDSFYPLNLLDYIYAVLHSPSYREKYKEFLKIDFPRVPYPTDKETFWKLVELGGQLRQIHLLESPKVEEYITTYPITGTNEITRKITKTSPGFEMTDKENKIGRVWINDEQYFDGVPELAWDFYIGGYQPAQKWLKDRQGRTLSYEDILHYQKIIVALTETNRLMKEIDAIPFLD